MKKILIFLAGFVLLLAIVAGGLVWQAMRGGSSTIEGWIGSQLQTITNAFLKPQLSFDDLDYEYPGTVSVKNLRLMAEDPESGKKVPIIGATHATLTLAEIPSIGKPIVIEKIILDSPVFQAIAVGPESSEFIGFSDLLQRKESEAPTTAEIISARAKLSDFFQMRLVQINDGRIVYDPRIADTVPMQLVGINTRLDIEPTEDGLYALAVKVLRDPIFDLSLAGKLNIDTFTASDILLKLKAELSEEKASYLPPQTQKLLKEYEIRGMLDVLVTGNVPALRYMEGNLQAEVTLTDSHVAVGEYRAPVDELHLIAQLRDGKIHLPALQLKAMRGTANVKGVATLNNLLDTDLAVSVNDIHLEDTLRTLDPNAPQKYAGRVNAHIHVAAPMKVVLEKATPPATQPSMTGTFRVELLPDLPKNWGQGLIKVDQARLVRLPVISDIAGFMTKGSSFITGRGDKTGKPADRVRLEFAMTEDAVDFSDITYVGDVVAARGAGIIRLDQALDLRVNGGPVEKMQAMLGSKVGGAIAMVTDNVVSYRVRGTVSAPHISVDVGGGHIGQISNKIGDVAGSVVGDGSSVTGTGAAVIDTGEDVVNKGANVVGEGAGAAKKGVTSVGKGFGRGLGKIGGSLKRATVGGEEQPSVEETESITTQPTVE